MKINTLFLSVAFCFILIGCKTKNDNLISTERLINEVSVSDTSYFVNKYGDTIRKLSKSASEWKQILNDKEFFVLREKGTEKAFSGDLSDAKIEGIFTCRGCGMPLFSSKHKFESGTGWPSFFDVLDHKGIHKETDNKLEYPRTELSCNKCGGHLGHVFDDGPKPTGLRYCINAASLDFVKTEN